MEKCMFGRQLEMERVITFSLHEEAHGHSFGVLPIAGPGKVGKRQHLLSIFAVMKGA
jgi:hypothetical protein